MTYKEKAVTLLTKLCESKYLQKAESCIVGAINRLSEGPKEVPQEEPAKKVTEVV